MANNFDVAQSRELPPGKFGNHGVPHAHAFVYRRLMKDRVPAHVPLFINTFYPPNQPSLRRCYDFGVALQQALRSWPADDRIAIVASGGLSHFVIDERLDKQVLSALERDDPGELVALGESHFQAGASETKLWIALAGALRGSGLRMQTLDYVPCYRSLAGTGQAMGFAQWVEQ
jgi:hypothetical protein